jgi:hypothetical protein
MAMIWLSRLANELSGKREILGADTVFPILVNVLINANISHIHPILVSRPHSFPSSDLVHLRVML